MKIKNIIVENYNHEYDDEAGMAETNLVTIARAAEGLLDTIEDHENLPEWVQEKIAKVEGMMVTAWNYLESQEAQGVAEGSLELNTPDPVVVIQDLKGNMLDKLNLSVASQKYKLGNPQNIKNQLAHQNYTTVGSYVVVSPMGGQPQDATTQGVAEDTQRVDSLVTDALKILRGAESNDAVQALKTVLGDREYNGRRGHYNFYVRQLVNMYRQQGIAEQTMSEGMPVDTDMGATTSGTKMTLGQWKQMWMKKMPGADAAAMFRSPPNMQGSAIAYFDGWMNNPDARWNPQQGMAEGELGEGWKEKLGGAALAGAMALGAGGAQARVTPDGQGGFTGGLKPTTTQQATDTAPTQSTSSFSVAKPQAQYDVDTRILTYKGKQYKWNSDAQATGQGEVVSAPSMAVGSRSMSPTKVELNPNGTYTKVPVNEVTGRIPDPQNYDSDWDYYNDRDAKAPKDDDADYENMIDEPNDWFDESRDKVGHMDADAFDAAIARMKKLAGAGPLKTVYDPARRVYRNVPTAQQPAKQSQK